MRQVIRNKYLKGFSFLSLREALTFLDNQGVNKNLSLEETFGENYYCYICYHSLTQEKLFSLSFSSDESEDNLNIMYWNDLIVLDIGKKIYLIDDFLEIRSSIEITTPLVGLYVINDERLLILEEAFVRVINNKGEVVRAELTDLIEDFSVKDNLLFIQTSEENRIIELN